MFLSDIVGANNVLDLAKLKSTKTAWRNPMSMIVLILRTTMLLIQVKKLRIVFKKKKKK